MKRFNFNFLTSILIFLPVCKSECITTGGKAPNKTCIFPFTARGKTYTACTYDISYVTGSKPWCSTDVDDRGNHKAGTWGTCEDEINCPIPPRECGVPVIAKTLDRKSKTSISQVPWMTSLGIYNDAGKWKHQCGGSLITNYHILTAAHCIPISLEDLKYKMRLGNANLNSDSHSEHEVERNVLKTLVHPFYKVNHVYFDVGLAFADKRIEFSDFVRPVCLPFQPVDDDDDLANSFVTLAGWGFDENYQITNQLEVSNLRINPKAYCSSVFGPERLRAKRIPPIILRQQLPKGFQPDITCAGSEIKIDGACEGDSGSPLIRLMSDTGRSAPYYELAFIVSAGVSCELEATLYIRVADRRILRWLQEVTDTTPLLMVVGGYTYEEVNGLTSDVEVISPATRNLCSKRVAPLPGRFLDLGTHVEKDSSALGITGQVTKDAAVLCGGKNGDDIQRKCYIYSPKTNRWKPGPSMILKRHHAASVLDENGNLWVLGGTDGSVNADSTEVFNFATRQWRYGKPLPSVLRDSGISSHCAVSINKTHVMIAGGYAGDYQLTFDHVPGFVQDKIYVPGYGLDRAWVFDGNYWQVVPPMSQVRDRPACNLVQFPDGQTRVLVAGGCEGWCSKNPAIKTAEMFDPVKREWSPVADLPVPLSSAKLEQFDGLATIVGGFDNEGLNELLYQYHPDKDEWIPHPTAKMRVPRSSAAVLQIPRSMLNDC